MKELVDQLTAEQVLLSQLIYRNHNQHSSTQLFSYFKNMNRVLKLITPERLLISLGKCESALKISAHVKVSQVDLLEVHEIHVMLFAVVNMLAEALGYTFKCSDVVRRLLSKRLFLPLYTMLLAITARIFHCLSGIYDHFYIQCNALTLQQQVTVPVVV